ncbi:MAG TPA: VOC family protein [Candidatus Syntrophosphaera sp.]|nr:VOC family protein [Candidatus Syntrophosphaera sp.]
MITINPYLNFNGNCLEAFEFYREVFGGEIPYISRYKDMPADSGHPLPEELKELIMHMSLVHNPQAVLMGADATQTFGGEVEFGSNISLMINAQTKTEVDTIWAKLSAGAQVTMPLQDVFWGDYFGMLTDKFGIYWMICCPSQKSE